MAALSWPAQLLDPWSSLQRGHSCAGTRCSSERGHRWPKQHPACPAKGQSRGSQTQQPGRVCGGQAG
ncbi:NDUFS7 isoform 13 [Pongo abelii]|uniref:NDUFS7 isoform 13 n=1 Tax=Pongo abelii TaxID=9601 RepID=A0A2J8R9P0_PONAB|nr:NDUFS7 isoform 13 [Pongo abelii]